MIVRPGLRRAKSDNATFIKAGVLKAPFVFTRTGNVATALAADNITVENYLANVPRFNGSRRGLLLEGTRTNLFLNSAVGATQDCTVTAALHGLSFTGTGSITLSGVSTAGPLVGTGTNTRVALTFTPTAGTLTLTVSGNVRNVNLELLTGSSGGAPSSWIPTDGSTATRNIDSCSATLATLGIADNGTCTLIFKGNLPFVSESGAQSILQIDDGTGNNRYFIRFQTAGSVLGQRVNATVVANMTSPGTINSGDNFTIGITLDGAGNFNACLNGGTVRTVAGGVTGGLTTLRVGKNSGTGEPLNGMCYSLKVLPYAVSDTTLQAMSI